MEIQEHAEHAQDAGEHGNRRAALLIAVLAAILAVSEQQAKRADIAVEENGIKAADVWNEYQAKSVRAALARDLRGFAMTFDAPSAPDVAARREAILRWLDADQAHYEQDPDSGKTALAARAQAFEARRERNLERSHTYDNASAALQLGIVLATASVITASRWLLRFAAALGVAGLALAILGAVAPELAVF